MKNLAKNSQRLPNPDFGKIVEILMNKIINKL